MPWRAQSRKHCWRSGLDKHVFSVVGRRRMQQLADAHGANKWYKKFFAVDHLRLAVALVLLPFRSLRALAIAVKGGGLLNRRGGEPLVSRSSLIDAFAHRPWRFFAAVYGEVVEATAKRCPPEPPGRRRRARSVKLIDATILPLIHRLVDVFTGTQGKASAKVNLRIDEPTRLPESLVVTAGRRHEKRTVERLIDWSQQAITYVFDRGYFSLTLFARLIDSGNYFVTLLKDNVTAWAVYTRKQYKPCWHEGFQLLADSVVDLPATGGHLLLRLVEAMDEQGNRWRVLTNHFDLSALEVCLLYRKRWGIENFFRTLKRQLNLREYQVANANAVMIIILCTLMAYCLAQALVFGFQRRVTLAEAIQLLQTLSAALMEGIEGELGEAARAGPESFPFTSADSIIVALFLDV